jgi:hypothetical protein
MRAHTHTHLPCRSPLLLPLLLLPLPPPAARRSRSARCCPSRKLTVVHVLLLRSGVLQASHTLFLM